MYSFRGYDEERDLEAMFALDEACFAGAFRFTLRAMRQFAGAKHAATVIAEDEAGRLAGFVIAHLEGETVYIVTLDVAAEQRRHGLGRALMQRAEESFAAARRVGLHVHPGNAEAVRFYEGMGYARAGEVRGFYGAGLDAWVYTKELGRDF